MPVTIDGQALGLGAAAIGVELSQQLTQYTQDIGTPAAIACLSGAATSGGWRFTCTRYEPDGTSLAPIVVTVDGDGNVFMEQGAGPTQPAMSPPVFNNTGSTDTSGTTGSGANTGTTSAAGTNSCGNGILVNNDTSCPFAQNVYDAFGKTAVSGTVALNKPIGLEVYSPITNKTYSVSCAWNTSPLATCTTATGAWMQFDASQSMGAFTPVATTPAVPPGPTSSAQSCSGSYTTGGQSTTGGEIGGITANRTSCSTANSVTQAWAAQRSGMANAQVDGFACVVTPPTMNSNETVSCSNDSEQVHFVLFDSAVP
ncbi:MAG: hypothetical protein ACLP8S_32680 [Solirubrobacteraceae bacterium]